MTQKGTNLRFANTAADFANVSTSVLIRLGFKPWEASDDLPSTGPLWLNGRVVRCQQDPSADASTWDCCGCRCDSGGAVGLTVDVSR